MPRIRRAILSCFDKTGVVEFAKALREYDVELISTSGTLEVLRRAGVEVIPMSEFTGVPELMDGRVKSLHLSVHAGLLGVRDNRLHEEQLQAHGLQWVDLVAVNLQPVETLIEQHGATVSDLLDQTDIGGQAMIRSAAKNFRYVTVVVNPRRYPTVIHELRAHEGEISFAARYRLAQEAFFCTAEYDMALAGHLRTHEPPEQ